MNPKDVIGQHKPPLHLIPAVAEIEESMVLKHGAEKYGAFNWRGEKIQASIYVAALKRHVAQWFDGENSDPESGASHLAHARACLGIMLDAIALGVMIDDRPTPGAASREIQRFTVKKPPGTGTLQEVCEQVEAEAIAALESGHDRNWTPINGGYH